MLRSTYNQNKHIFFFPGRLNFNEHVNSNHIKKFLWLEKKMYKHQCPCKKKKKSQEFFGNNNNDRMKMKVRDEMSTSYLMFLADQREPINTAGRSHKSHLFTMQCQQHIEPTIWSIPRFTYHLKHLNRLLNIPDFLLFCHFLFSNDPWS